jgi:hypothetical protein
VNNWRVIFATVVIFGAGVITGGLLVDYVQDSHKPGHKLAGKSRPANTNQVVRPTDAGKPSKLPEMLSKQFLQRLDKDLHLAPEQHEAIEKIIAASQNRMRVVMQESQQEIRGVLTPEQRLQFDELMKRQFRKPGGTNAAPGTLAPTNAPAI